MIYYKKWKTQRGSGAEVSEIEFVDYVRKDKKVYTFIQDDIKYLGEIWLVEDQEGNKIEVKVRREYNPDLFETSTNVLPHHLVDLWYNPIVDPPDYVHARIRGEEPLKKDYRNKELDQKSKESSDKFKNYRRLLSKIRKKDNKSLYNYVKLKIKFLKSPDYITMRKLQRIQSEFQPHINEMLQTI